MEPFQGVAASSTSVFVQFYPIDSNNLGRNVQLDIWWILKIMTKMLIIPKLLSKVLHIMFLHSKVKSSGTKTIAITIGKTIALLCPISNVAEGRVGYGMQKRVCDNVFIFKQTWRAVRTHQTQGVIWAAKIRFISHS